MTFSVVQHDMEVLQVVGTLWTDDESRAQAIAAQFFPSFGDSLFIRRTEEREIPMHLDVAPPKIH